MADARVREEVVDILQAAAGTVDVELAFPAAVEPAGHHHFPEIHRQSAVIGKEQGHLRQPQGLSGGRARKDDVLSPGSAQIADVLLTQHPADSIGDIALAAAVRPYDGGDARVKIYGYLIGKGLEAICLQSFKLQLCLAPFRLVGSQKPLLEFICGSVLPHEISETVVHL